MRFDKPFYVGYNNEDKWRGMRFGYLPPLEEPIVEEPQLDIPPENKLWYQLQQLKGNLIFLDKKINEHLSHTKKRKDIKYKDYIIEEEGRGGGVK